jgi:threonine dehydratase
MPAETPFVKVVRTEAFGATILLEGSDLSEAAEVADRRAAERGLVLVHPYDDAEVICGQGTVALEMLAARPDLDLLMVPVGGGGLISGVATAAKAINPATRIVGVQVETYDFMTRALAGETRLPSAGATLAEGIAVKRPGRLTQPIVAALVEEMVTVSEAMSEQAVGLLADRQHLVAEGAGAAGIAALMTHAGRWRDRHIGIVLSGANIDQRLLSSILLRELVRRGQLVRLRAEISDQPGNLARLSQVIGACAGNIVEIVHQRMFLDIPVKNTEVDFVLETRNEAHVAEIQARLAAAGFTTRLLSLAGRAGEEEKDDRHAAPNTRQ